MFVRSGGELLKTVPALEAVGSVILADVLPSAAMLQIGYGTSIVSFLGAVHWYVWSPVVSLYNLHFK